MEMEQVIRVSSLFPLGLLRLNLYMWLEVFVLNGRPEVAEWGALFTTSSNALKLPFKEFSLLHRGVEF